MPVHRAIVLDDGQNGFVTVVPKRDDSDVILFELSGTIWACAADIRKFAYELLAAYLDPNPTSA